MNSTATTRPRWELGRPPPNPDLLRPLLAANPPGEPFRFSRLCEAFDVAARALSRSVKGGTVRAQLAADIKLLRDERGTLSVHWAREPEERERVALRFAWVLCGESATAVVHLVAARSAGGDGE